MQNFSTIFIRFSKEQSVANITVKCQLLRDSMSGAPSNMIPIQTIRLNMCMLTCKISTPVLLGSFAYLLHSTTACEYITAESRPQWITLTRNFWRFVDATGSRIVHFWPQSQTFVNTLAINTLDVVTSAITSTFDRTKDPAAKQSNEDHRRPSNTRPTTDESDVAQTPTR